MTTSHPPKHNQVLRLRGVRSIVKFPGQEDDDSCPDRLLLLSQEVSEHEGQDAGPMLSGEGGGYGYVRLMFV